MSTQEFIIEYLGFFLKVFTILAAFLLLACAKQTSKQKPVKFELLNKKRLKQIIANNKEVSGKKTVEKDLKSMLKKVDKMQDNLFIIDLKCDIKASEVESLREVVTAIIDVAKPGDRVLVKLESPGGEVAGYGLAASQIARFRNKNIHVTASIDKVAASGGYMIAAVADRIIAAPFAVVGSIGVIVQAPNLHNFLKKRDIDVIELTAGDYKRTLTLLGENSEKGKKKAQEQIDSIHESFKSHVAAHRSEVSIKDVGTGEIWLAKDAIDKKLVDSIQTSDDFISNSFNQFRVIKVNKDIAKTKMQKLQNIFANLNHSISSYNIY